MAQHSELTGDDLHDVKGVDVALEGQVLSADGLGASVFVDPSTLLTIQLGEEASGFSNVSQAPTSTGVSRVLDFTNVDSSSDVEVDLAGTFTVLNDGIYYITWEATLGRSSGSGTARIGFRLQKNGSQLGRAKSVFAAGTGDYIPLQFNLLIYLEAGDVLRSQIIRDSAGDNSGEANGRDLTDWNDGASVSATAVRILGG